MSEQSLVELIHAASAKMNAKAWREQRVSFVYGQSNGKMTKAEIRAKLARIYGWEDEGK